MKNLTIDTEWDTQGLPQKKVLKMAKKIVASNIAATTSAYAATTHLEINFSFKKEDAKKVEFNQYVPEKHIKKLIKLLENEESAGLESLFLIVLSGMNKTMQKKFLKKLKKLLALNWGE